MRSKWIITSISCILLGSATATIEILLTSSIDSLLPKVNQIKDFKQRGSITFLSTNEKIIKKIGPSTQKKLESGQIPKKVQEAVNTVEGVNNVKVDLVWDPPWDMSRMSDVARLELDMM